MIRQPVPSSQIKAIGWERDAGAVSPGMGVLEVEFHRAGAVYRYAGVPVDVFAELMAEAADVSSATAPEASVGALFNRLVKKGGYAYERVASDGPAPPFTAGALAERIALTRASAARRGIADPSLTLSLDEAGQLLGLLDGYEHETTGEER